MNVVHYVFIAKINYDVQLQRGNHFCKLAKLFLIILPPPPNFDDFVPIAICNSLYDHWACKISLAKVSSLANFPFPPDTNAERNF